MDTRSNESITSKEQTNNETIKRLIELEQQAISGYTDCCGITDIILEHLDEEDIKEYNKLHLKHYGTCFYCGADLDCNYCEKLLKEEQTNEQ